MVYCVITGQDPVLESTLCSSRDTCMKEVFAEIDTEKTGRIDKIDCVQALNRMGVHVEEKDCPSATMLTK